MKYITEAFFAKSKSYVLNIYDPNKERIIEKKRSKGVKMNVIEKDTCVNDFREAIFENKNIKKTQRGIVSKSINYLHLNKKN